MKKPLFITAAIITAVAAVAFGILMLTINTGPGNRLIKTIVEESLSAQMNGRLEVGRVRFITPRLYEAYDVVIRNYESADAPEIHAEKLRGRIHILPFFKGRVVFPWVHGWGITAIYNNNTKKSLFTIFTLPPERLGGPVVDVSITSIVAHRFTVIFRDTVSKTTVRVETDSVRGALNHSYFFNAKLYASHGRISVDSLSWSIDSLFGNLSVDSLKLVVDRVALRANDCRINGAGWLGFQDTCFVDARFTGTGGSSTVQQIANRFDFSGIEQAGTVDAKVAFTRSLKHPRMTFSAATADAAFRNVGIASLKTSGVVDTGRFDCKGNLLSTAGAIDLDYRSIVPRDSSRGALFVDIESRDVDLEKLLSAAGLSALGLCGTASGKVHWEQKNGTTLPRRLQASLSGSRLRFSTGIGEGINADIAFGLNGSRWHFDLRNPTDILSGAGTVSSAGALLGDLSLSSSEIEGLAEALLPDHLSGVLDATATLGGSLGRPLITGRGRGENAAWADIQIDSIDGGFKVDGVRFFFDHTSVKAHGPAEALKGFSVAGLSGSADALLSLNGPLDSISGDGNAHAAHLSYFGTRVADTAHARIAFSPGRFSLDGYEGVCDATVVAGGFRLFYDSRATWGDGSVTLSKAFGGGGECAFAITRMEKDTLEARLKTTSLSIDALRPWLGINSRDTLQLTGNLDLNATVAGPLSNPLLSTDLSLTSFKGWGVSLDRITGSAALKDSLLTASASIFIPDSLSVSAQLPLHPGSGYALDTTSPRNGLVSFSGRDVDFAPMLSRFVKGFSAPTLRADCDIGLLQSGRWWWPDGDISVPDASLVFNAIPVGVSKLKASFQGYTTHSVCDITAQGLGMYGVGASNVRLSGMVDKRYLVIDTARIPVGSGGLFISGTVPHGLGASYDRTFLDCKIEKIPVTAANALVNGLNFSKGTISGNAIVTDVDTRPAYFGTLTADSVLFAPDGIGPQIGPLSLSANFDNANVAIPDLSGKWGDGTLQGTVYGSFDTAGLFKGTAMLRGRRLFIEIPTAGIGVDAADLEIDIAKRYKVSGSIALGETRYFQAVGLAGNAVPIPDSTVSSVDLDLKLALMSKLNAEISFGQQGGRSVLGTNALLDGNLIIGGTAASPLLSGEMKVVNGDMTFLDRSFTIQKGTFNQYDQYAFNPQINFTATAKVDNQSSGNIDTVTLIVDGTLNEPQISMQSKPAYNEAEIFSLLTFGRPSLFTSSPADATSQSGIGGRAQSILLSQLYGYTSRKAEEILGLEDVRLDANLSLKDPTLKVSGARSIGKDVKVGAVVSYDNSTEGMRKSKATLSWHFLPFLYLEGEAAADGTGGLDLKFKWER